METSTFVYPYSYDDLLFRLHTIKTGQQSAPKNSLPVMKTTKKNRLTVIVNFGVYEEKLNRPIQHIADFFREETKAIISINDKKQLLIHANLNQTKCENIMRNYVREYVTCSQCNGIDTIITRESGLSFMICNQCSARTSMGKLAVIM